MPVAKEQTIARMLFRDMGQWGAEMGVSSWKRLVVKWGGF